jgi:hypothetical protein
LAAELSSTSHRHRDRAAIRRLLVKAIRMSVRKNPPLLGLLASEIAVTIGHMS